MTSKNQPQAEPKVTEQVQPKIRIRLIPIWLRLILIAVLTVMALIAGSIVGYSLIGDGKAGEVFQPKTWIHIKDLVVKE